MIVFFYLFEKRIVSVKQLELESVHQILNVPSLLFSETHGVPGYEHMSLDGRLGAPGVPRSLSLDLCNSKMFSLHGRNKGWRQFCPSAEENSLLKGRAGSVSEKQPLPIKVLPPSQDERLLNLCAAIQTARSSCPATAALLLRAGPRCLCILKVLMPNLWGSSLRDLARSGNLPNMTSFLELNRTRWCCLHIAWSLIVQI